MANTYLVYLEWSEKCFRTNAEALRLLRANMPRGSRVFYVKDEATFLKRLPLATHVLVWYFREEWFAQAVNLRVVATPAAGQELVPVHGPEGVTIHFGHFHGPIMAESVAAFMLGWARGFFLRPVDATWPRNWMSDKIYDVAGTKAVILGYGNVGRAIGEKLTAIGVEVFGYSRHLRIKPSTLDNKLHHADWLVMALPGGLDTERVLNTKLIAKLPKNCVVINVGRGSTIDERALFSALTTRRLAGAYLDVRTTEPYRRFALPGGTKGLPPTPKLDNLVLMPHASAFSPKYMAMFIRELIDDGVI